MSPRLRPPTERDISTAARLVAEHWPEAIDDERIRRDWTSPRVDLARDARIGDDAYVLVEDIGEGRVWIEVHGGAVSDALDWAERRGAETGATRLLSGAWSTNAGVLDELVSRGFALTRQSRRMEIALSSPLDAPAWSGGIEVRTMREGEERTVYDVQQEAFRDTWEPMSESFEEWGHWLLQPPRFAPELWFVAVDADEICGIALCHPHPTVRECGWVAVVGVRRHWRRRGVGRALLLHALHALAARGFERAALGVDSGSPTGAHTLYEAVGMRATQRFDSYEKTVA